MDVLDGYRYQLRKKRQQIIREIQAEHADLYASNDQETSFEQEQRIRIEPLMVPSAPQEYQEHLKNVKMQLDICELSLKEGKKSEMKERIEQASDILFKTTDGLEDELVAYQKAAAKTLYREIEQSASIGFESVSSVNKLSEASIQTKKIQKQKTEASAKEMITKWKQDMQFLVHCAKLTGFLPSFLYLCGCMAFAAGVYFPVHKGEGVQSVYAGLCAMAVIIIFLAVGSFNISGYFMKEIRKSYAHLQNQIEQVLKAYQFRAQDYENCLNEWLCEFNKQQFKNDQAQKNQGKNEQVSARAWHLANIKRILDLLDSFGFEQNNHVTVQTEDATIASRIVQPMDYSQKELGNECYWPVWTENEIERGQGR